MSDETVQVPPRVPPEDSSQPVKTMEDLVSQESGTVLKAKDLAELEVHFSHGLKKKSKWVAKTGGHEFKVGDIYVLDKDLRLEQSFMDYIRKAFDLSADRITKDGKILFRLRKKMKTNNGAKRGRKAARKSVSDVNFK